MQHAVVTARSRHAVHATHAPSQRCASTRRPGVRLGTPARRIHHREQAPASSAAWPTRWRNSSNCSSRSAASAVVAAGPAAQKDSRTACSTRADEAVLMVSSSRVGHAACIVGARTAPSSSRSGSVLCTRRRDGTGGVEDEERPRVREAAPYAVQRPGSVVAHIVPKGGRLDAVHNVSSPGRCRARPRTTLGLAGLRRAAVVYLASAAPPAPRSFVADEGAVEGRPEERREGRYVKRSRSSRPPVAAGQPRRGRRNPGRGRSRRSTAAGVGGRRDPAGGRRRPAECRAPSCGRRATEPRLGDETTRPVLVRTVAQAVIVESAVAPASDVAPPPSPRRRMRG